MWHVARQQGRDCEYRHDKYFTRKTKHEQSVNHISRSLQRSWWGLVLGEMCPAQWVALQNMQIGLSFFFQGNGLIVCLFMWQSCVEINDNSVAYFNHITAFKAFKAPYRWTSIKGQGSYICFVDLLDIHAFTKQIWAPPFSDTAFKHSDAIEICNRIILISTLIVMIMNTHLFVAGVFIARGKEDALVTKNLVPGESVYGEKRISVEVSGKKKKDYDKCGPSRRTK